jgi:O-antigen ligase
MAIRGNEARILFPIFSSASFRARDVLYVLAIVFALVYGQYNELSMGLDVPLIQVAGNSLFFLDILLFICLGVWVLTKHKLVWGRPPQMWLLLFLLWTVVVGLGRSLALDIPYHTWIRELRTIAYFVFILLLPEAIDSKGRAIVLARLLLISSFAVAIMALAVRINHLNITPQPNLLEYTETGAPRIFMVYGAERAMYAALFAMGALLVYRSRFLWLAVAFNVVTLILGLTRGAYLGVFVGIVMTFALVKGRRGLPRMLAFLIAFAGIVYIGTLFMGAITGGEQAHTFLTRLTDLKEDLVEGSGTFAGRLVEARVVTEFLLNNPDALLFGQGLGGFFEDPLGLLTAEIQYLGDRRYSYVHNGYLWTVLRSGLIGAAFFYTFWLALIFKSLRWARRTRDPELKGILVGIISVVIGTLTLSLSGQPLGEGPRISALTLYAAIGLATIRLARQADPSAAAPQRIADETLITQNGWRSDAGAVTKTSFSVNRQTE